LISSGVKIVKIFLHISKEFQREKLISRIENPEKNWKFDPADLRERKSWDEYVACYEDIFAKCSKAAPWHIVPADHRWYRNYEVLRIATEALRGMKLPSPAARPDLLNLLDELNEAED
jgi:polyphosphate kinase 2 (PPK2 family)